MKKYVFFTLGILTLTPSALAADNNVSVTNDMQSVLSYEMSSQSAFDAAYQQLSENAFLDVKNRVVVQKDELVSALMLTIDQQTAYGNTKVVDSLEQILNFINNSSNTFSEDYSKEIPTSSINQEADQEALQALQVNLSSTFNTVQQSISNFEEMQATLRSVAISYINGNSSNFGAMEGQMPLVPDGTTASIFAIDNLHGCYYVNAGEYSGAVGGTQYAITDISGQYIGNIQIIKTTTTYSVGVLNNTSDVPLGSLVPALQTKTTNYVQ